MRDQKTRGGHPGKRVVNNNTCISCSSWCKQQTHATSFPLYMLPAATPVSLVLPSLLPTTCITTRAGLTIIECAQKIQHTLSISPGVTKDHVGLTLLVLYLESDSECCESAAFHQLCCISNLRFAEQQLDLCETLRSHKCQF